MLKVLRRFNFYHSQKRALDQIFRRGLYAFPSPRVPSLTNTANMAEGETVTPVAITAAPVAKQLVEHEGKTYTTVKEGLAYILVPPNARTSVDPQAKSKAGERFHYSCAKSIDAVVADRCCRILRRQISSAECLLQSDTAVQP